MQGNPEKKSELHIQVWALKKQLLELRNETEKLKRHLQIAAELNNTDAASIARALEDAAKAHASDEARRQLGELASALQLAEEAAAGSTASSWNPARLAAVAPVTSGGGTAGRAGSTASSMKSAWLAAVSPVTSGGETADRERRSLEEELRRAKDRVADAHGQLAEAHAQHDQNLEMIDANRKAQLQHFSTRFAKAASLAEVAKIASEMGLIADTAKNTAKRAAESARNSFKGVVNRMSSSESVDVDNRHDDNDDAPPSPSLKVMSSDDASAVAEVAAMRQLFLDEMRVHLLGAVKIYGTDLTYEQWVASHSPESASRGTGFRVHTTKLDARM